MESAGRAGAGRPSGAGAARPVTLADADWSAPWFAAVAGQARTIPWHDPHGALAALNQRAATRALATASGCPVEFVDAALAGADAYERQIARTGRVPTRLHGDGFVHDALSALAWLSLPRTKAALNALQAAEIDRTGVGSRRGVLRDAATLFDENGLLLAAARDAPQARAVVGALRERRWRAALVGMRAAWRGTVEPVVFGHALMQKLLRPFPAITAHAWVVPLPADWFGLAGAERRARLDAAVAAGLGQTLSDRSARLPLPVLGVPGWWPDNARPGFYDDPEVFRPRSATRTDRDGPGPPADPGHPADWGRPAGQGGPMDLPEAGR